jgi:recombination protein RecT
MNDVAEVKSKHPIAKLRQDLETRTDEFKRALPSHIKPERFIRAIETAVTLNPDILACDRVSLWTSCMRAAQDGLLPDNRQGAIVAFKNKAQWIPMYEGLLLLFRNSGQFRHINTGVVYQGEEFTHWIDENGEHFRHVPGDERDPKKIRRIYATATTKDGAFFVADLSLQEVNRHKAASRNLDGPWRQWEQEMQRKTALRVLSKMLPKSSDLDEIMHRDEQGSIETVEERRHAVTRPADTVSALDAFGAYDPQTLSGERQGSETPEGGGTVASESRADSAARETDNGPANFSHDLEVKAYERGKEARARGTAKRAIPSEYHEISKLAIAWIRGWEEGSK